MKTKASLRTNSVNRLSRHCWTVAGLLIAFVVTCFAISPQAPAACQEGCLTNANTVLGEDALFSLTTGLDNTAIGFNALYHNTTGSGNTATGWSTLFNNTTGFTNTGAGVYALISNTTGFQNTAIGGFALGSNSTGFENTAIGEGALFANSTGVLNTANGFQALSSNTTGAYNTANGANALDENTTGSNNTAAGLNALRRNTIGEGNTASGSRALVRNTTGNDNIALGNNAGENLTTGNNNIDIGNRGVVGESNTIRIGSTSHMNTYISGINGVTVVGGVGVLIDTNGHLGTSTSSARFKDDIQPMDKASEAIYLLKPVIFRYKRELDPNGIPQFGLIAEDVEKLSPHLVARDEEGKPYSVRYEAVNAMLLNEFLKEHRKVEEEAEINRQQQASIARLEAFVKEQAAQIQRVTAQLAAKNAGERLVSSD
jgi:Chaperone of endosialidase